MRLCFYYLLIASSTVRPCTMALPLLCFYYLLIASERYVVVVFCEVESFYYLLIASVVCSSRALLYGFPCPVLSLSLNVEHPLSVSV